MNEVQIRTATLPERIRVQRALLDLSKADFMLIGDEMVFEAALKGRAQVQLGPDANIEIRRHRFRGECSLRVTPRRGRDVLTLTVRFMGAFSPQGEVSVAKMFVPLPH